MLWLAISENEHGNTVRFSVVSIITATVLLLSACGGGGSSTTPTPTPPTTPPATGMVELNWQAQQRRTDGSAMPNTERGDYLILFFKESELNANQPLWGNIDSLSNFDSGGSEIGYFIKRTQLNDIATAASNNVIQVNATSLSHQFDALTSGNYHFAIATRDSDGKFGHLSNTVTTSIP